MLMLDTHIAVALYQGKTAGLSRKTLKLIDREALCFSPAVLLELELLHEIGRIRRSAAVVGDYLQRTLAISCADDPFSAVVRQALPLAFSRDPFDRLIVAHAACRKAGLITLDQHIHAHYEQCLA